MLLRHCLACVERARQTKSFRGLNLDGHPADGRQIKALGQPQLDRIRRPLARRCAGSRPRAGRRMQIPVARFRLHAVLRRSSHIGFGPLDVHDLTFPRDNGR